MGALTLKTNTFQTRPWEIWHKNSIAINDSFLPNIRIETRDKKIFKFVPIEDQEEWISDKSRFFKKYTTSANTVIGFPTQISKITLKETFMDAVLKGFYKLLSFYLSRKKNLTLFSVLLDATSDIVFLNSVKNMEKTYPYSFFISKNLYSQNEIFNKALDEDLMLTYDFIIMSDISKYSTLFHAKILEIQEEGKEIFNSTTNILDVKKENIFCNNFFQSFCLVNSRMPNEEDVLTICSSYLTNYLKGAFFSVFVLSDAVENLYNFYTKFWTKVETYVNINNALQFTKKFVNVLNLLPSVEDLMGFFVPALSIWKSSRIFKISQEIKRTFAVLKLKLDAKNENYILNVLVNFSVILSLLSTTNFAYDSHAFYNELRKDFEKFHEEHKNILELDNYEKVVLDNQEESEKWHAKLNLLYQELVDKETYILAKAKKHEKMLHNYKTLTRSFMLMSVKNVANYNIELYFVRRKISCVTAARNYVIFIRRGFLCSNIEELYREYKKTEK